ncbi:hypothetical protein [Salinarimonas ramus]|uniref:Uncharacterized protein n=1 Tax=Salinarimonas ramus TaxID=690164 RepID=A0A917V3Y2_9HYPH|nr:hypothetical protein [Salinarimonas ramus]GGK36200.1 hypothetical protein GCM10011322_24030 [Salinarimonas ramus]
MRGNPITGAAQGVSITDTVARGQRILEERPEPRGRERYAGRTNRPPRGANASFASDRTEAETADTEKVEADGAETADAKEED